MYNQTAPMSGYGHGTAAGSSIPNGMGGMIHKAPPLLADKPSGIVMQAVEMVADAISQAITARKDLSLLGDRLLGTQPECNDGNKMANPVADGYGHQLLGNINALHREIAALRAEITRLDAL